jgi:type VI protein secretion system component Hcp
MASNNNLDILMKIVDVKSGAIAGEGMSTLDQEDPYTEDFKPGLFFEIEDFDVGIGLEDTDSSSRKSAQTPGPGGALSANQTAQDAKKTGKFAKWVQGLDIGGGGGGTGSQLFPIQLEEVSITRQIDQASPLLFQRCFLTQDFASATLVMRKAGDLMYGPKGNIASMPFLRIDFKPILITSITWDVGDVVKEKLKFVCREIKVQYRPQKNDGSAGKNVPTTAPLTLVKTKK